MADAEAVLRTLLDQIIKEPYKSGQTTFGALTSGGANYTSALYSATVTKENEDDLKLFAKVANVSENNREMVNVRIMFDTELYVYKDISKIYDRLQERLNIPHERRFEFPKFYGGDDTPGTETIVLEDLVAKGYSPYSRFKVIDWEHATCAVDTLTRFHALSFAFAKEEPEMFAKACDKLAFTIPPEHNNPMIQETWRRMMTSAAEVAREEDKDKITEFLLRDTAQREIYKFKLPLGTKVLCHGDYRVSNLMFRRQNGRLETIVVDYQTVHTGCPAIDLLYLEFMGTDVTFRRQYHDRLVEYYFSKLTEALDQVGLDVNDVYPRETFDSELKEMIPAALRLASFVLPLVLVEADNAPQLGGSGTVEDFALTPTELFAERYSGIISDCVRWGVI